MCLETVYQSIKVNIVSRDKLPRSCDVPNSTTVSPSLNAIKLCYKPLAHPGDEVQALLPLQKLFQPYNK